MFALQGLIQLFQKCKHVSVCTDLCCAHSRALFQLPVPSVFPICVEDFTLLEEQQQKRNLMAEGNTLANAAEGAVLSSQ